MSEDIFDLDNMEGVAFVDELPISKEEKEFRDFGQYQVDKEDTTCWNCSENKTCKVAWDAYNTDGDCLNK